MTEDSGAFKTNSVNWGEISAFCDYRRTPLQRSRSGYKSPAGSIGSLSTRYLTSTGKPLRYSRSSLIRCVRAISGASRMRPVQLSPRSPMFPGPSQNSCKGGIRLFMLPGFRFLFVAIVLSMSMLVFGLGAAALLRAAHEEVVSTPSWRGAPETMFAQQSDATRPVLAVLSVAPPATVQTPSDPVPAAAAPAEQATAVAAPASPEPSVALKPEASLLPDASKPEIPPAEVPAQSEAAPAPGDAPAATGITTTVPPASQAAPASPEPVSFPAAAQPAGAPAAVEQASTPAPAEQASAPARAEQASAPAAPENNTASTKLATLGGPAASSEEQSPARRAIIRAHRSAKKHEAARRVVRRRVIAQRARIEPSSSQPPATSFTFTPLPRPFPGG
ncbi:hypothetical protein [Bradyrhizobium sp.]|jgi:hypothetical protein|uniref:hypothetical protein n=1 Tax=Bradyrhizobium sp. TaxID=376 RepID=UPI003C242EE3